MRRPSIEQPSWPEDVEPRDIRRDVVGLESYRGWGPIRGPIACTELRNWAEGIYRHAGIYRAHDYEQLWYRSRAWFCRRAGLPLPN